MELLGCATKTGFVAVVLQDTRVKEVRLETLGRDETWLNITLLCQSQREKGLDENNDPCLTYSVYSPHRGIENVSLLENVTCQMHMMFLGNISHIRKVRRPSI